MSSIEFRGKRTDNGEWVDGFYTRVADVHYILSGIFDSLTNGIINTRGYKVIPETVCQFTGLYDKNGRKIFEGDIVEHDHPYGGKSVHTVIWNKYGWNLSDFYATYFDDPGEAFSEGTEFMTVIGNIYDNPELLEVKPNEM